MNAHSIEVKPSATERLIMNADDIAGALSRLAQEVLERRSGGGAWRIVGLQPRGVFVAKRLHRLLVERCENPPDYGELDATFFRDDLHLKTAPILPERTALPFGIERSTVLLVDDVLYTGRTVLAAINALLSYGRPDKIELLTLIDRKSKRQIPVTTNYVGIELDTLDTERVFLRWQENGADADKVWVERGARR